jgi:hypothetical protein
VKPNGRGKAFFGRAAKMLKMRSTMKVGEEISKQKILADRSVSQECIAVI